MPANKQREQDNRGQRPGQVKQPQEDEPVSFVASRSSGWQAEPPHEDRSSPDDPREPA
jgi:hypothetical protein